MSHMQAIGTTQPNDKTIQRRLQWMAGIASSRALRVRDTAYTVSYCLYRLLLSIPSPTAYA
eukprot:4960428-Pyramimonas_sp.AAC.1